ncbi:MAG TPA: hypothetical protein VKQ08_08970, partial [Cyclobacteriaceae bacterium]|nr:hypothetical protein [Cyclobacteriaceae bacterium]
MRKNVISENGGQAKSKKKAVDLAHALRELEESRRELRTQKQERKATEASLAKFRRLFDLMARNFPGGQICILNQGAGSEDTEDTDPINLPNPYIMKKDGV